MSRGRTVRIALAAAWAAGASGSGGCGAGATSPDQPVDAASAEVDPGSPQRPPQGQEAIEGWLAGAFHRTGGWLCEAGTSLPRLSGMHGRHRICWNELLTGSKAGVYPVGAAAVKELYTTGELPNGFAVGLKVLEGEGTATWYWYERRGASPTAVPLADGVGLPQCAVCHGTATRDQIFIAP